MRAQRPQAEQIVESATGADGRAPRHEHAAAGGEQSLRDHQVLGGVGKDLEALGAEGARRLGEAEHIRLQRVVLADNLELDPWRAEYLARHVRRRNRLLDRMATG